MSAPADGDAQDKRDTLQLQAKVKALGAALVMLESRVDAMESVDPSPTYAS